MSSKTPVKGGWKQKLRSEMTEYLITAAYLACFFGLLTWYRRLILAEYHISYIHYGVSLIEALVLAKIILLGDALGLGRRFQDKPLMVTTLFRTVMFTLWVAAFSLLEHTIGGLLRGHGMSGGLEEIIHRGRYELLARCLITFFAFIPFFAFKELERVLGKGAISQPFLKGRKIN